MAEAPSAVRVYRETRKKHDQVFNMYIMRPLAAVVVAAVARTRVTPNQLTLLNLALFIAAAALLVALPTWEGGLWAVLVLEASYCLDCADGMLARYKNIASKEGHLFDFFTDELKAVLLALALPIRVWRSGGFGFDAKVWPAQDARFLLGGAAGVAIVASAISLTNFVRRPEISGRETTVEAYYDVQGGATAAPLRLRIGRLVATFLRWCNHYPSHIWLWAIGGRMDVYMWIYLALNGVYLARGWLGVAVRFGRPS
ncbi:MAG TPA: CDP-alcohol phosphatidyltransferase family protein [Polyangiaceae bacterium]|nr:CDP-alcohol phosphatidyltransferase family protein [Polyangiaceae bacterium]